jgi:hypothetical protein
MSDPCHPSRLPATVLWFIPAPPLGGDCSAAAAPAAAARTVSGDGDRSVSSQTTVRASNVRRVTPKLDKTKKATRLLSLSTSPPRTAEEMFQQRILRDRQWAREERRRNRQWAREELQRIRLRVDQLEERVDRLNRQTKKPSPHVQALVGASEGRHRNSPAPRRDNVGSCCFFGFFFCFRFQAHRRQGAVVGPLVHDEQNIIRAMGEPLETTTNRQETLIKRVFSWGAITAPSRQQFTKEV